MEGCSNRSGALVETVPAVTGTASQDFKGTQYAAKSAPSAAPDQDHHHESLMPLEFRSSSELRAAIDTRLPAIERRIHWNCYLRLRTQRDPIAALTQAAIRLRRALRRVTS